VKPHDWVTDFGELVSINGEGRLVNETQQLDPHYIEELDTDFTKEEVRV
jgi:hypothetical protein